jgi:hypothetical protein
MREKRWHKHSRRVKGGRLVRGICAHGKVVGCGGLPGEAFLPGEG